jgi:GH35 family endo-1,4-beta-xylanase
MDTDSDSDSDTDTDSDSDSDTDVGFGSKFVGNIPTWGTIRDDFLDYWDQLTPENAGKWDACEGTQDVMRWDRLEPMYNYAKEHGIPFKQHTMVWGRQSPFWLNNLSGGEVAEEIEEWFAAYCEKFPDTDMIDVVNEPVHEPAGYAQQVFGDDWVVRVFEIAHQYCPNSILILNDFNVLRWDTDAFIAYAEPVMEAGLLDAVGCQAHGLHDQSFEELKTNLQKIADIGAWVYISEYDIDVADDNQQKNIMEQQFTLFYEHPSVAGITLWGYILGRTWRANTGIKHESGAHRPALDWLMSYLER